MEISKNCSNLNTTSKANIKLTPYVKERILKMPSELQDRFIKAQNKLMNMDNNAELMLSRKKTFEGTIIPVITNLSTGAMIASLGTTIKNFSKNTINLIEAIASDNDNFAKKIFTKNPFVIENSINRIMNNTRELSIHPAPYQKLSHIELNTDEQMLMKNLEANFPKKEAIFKLKEDKKLFIKRFDEGYIYYICDINNMPNGQYFTATYTKNGFQLNYDEKYISKELVLKYFKRYSQKTIENVTNCK